jgi:hypothetical protein
MSVNPNWVEGGARARSARAARAFWVVFLVFVWFWLVLFGFLGAHRIFS